MHGVTNRGVDRKGLSEAEQRVVAAICSGLFSYKTLAAHLLISENTLRTHMQRIHQKLEVQSMAELLWVLIHHEDL